MGSATLWLGMLFSCVGGGYFIYGKKQADFVTLISGSLLCILPYFMHNAIILSLVSLSLMGLPFAAHKYL